MINAIPSITSPANEPVLDYRPGCDEQSRIKNEIQLLRDPTLEIPLIIGGHPVRTGKLGQCIIPHDHRHQLAVFRQAGEKEVAPFNFTAIAGNLPSAPAMLGNTVLWNPASTAVYSAWMLMETFMQAGLPPGEINLLPGPGSLVGDPVLANSLLAAIHFTGSTLVFQRLWKTLVNNLDHYRTYPRIVGETGGKDFSVVHARADPDAVVAGPILGAFDTNTDYITYAQEHEAAEIIAGGNSDDSTGYFIDPTAIVTTAPQFKTMREEIFGPVLTLYVNTDSDFEEVLDLCDRTSPYVLTVAIFANDREVVATARHRLVNAAGNFYINDKPTGAVMGRQPFGCARASGTNDKGAAF